MGIFQPAMLVYQRVLESIRGFFVRGLMFGELFGGKYFDRLLEVGGPGYDEGFSRWVGGWLRGDGLQGGKALRVGVFFR